MSKDNRLNFREKIFARKLYVQKKDKLLYGSIVKSNLVVLVVTLTMLFANCVIKNKTECNLSWSNTINSKSYFPTNIFSDKQDLNQFKVNWYTSYLIAMKEVPLYQTQHIDESYRFLLLPSFTLPIMVRVQKCGSKYELTTKELTGNRMSDPGVIKRQKSKTLSQQEWQQIINNLDSLHFWTLPTREEKVAMVDGMQWVVEGVKEDKYHIVDRILPSIEFQKVCLYLVKISELMNDEELLAFEKNINQ